MGRHLQRGALICALAVSLAACAATYRNHGYAPSDVAMADLELGVDTKESVAEKIGRPGASGVVREDVWYYVESRMESYAYRAPVEVDRQVVVISFSTNDRLRNVERFGLEDGEVIALNRRVTDSNIEGVSFIRQLLGNVGRIDAGQFLD